MSRQSALSPKDFLYNELPVDLPVPVEILRKILFCLQEELTSEYQSYPGLSLGLSEYSKLALVARRWTPIVEEALWRFVAINEGSSYERFYKWPEFGQFVRNAHVSLSVSSDDQWKNCANVLAGFLNLEILYWELMFNNPPCCPMPPLLRLKDLTVIGPSASLPQIFPDLPNMRRLRTLALDLIFPGAGYTIITNELQLKTLDISEIGPLKSYLSFLTPSLPTLTTLYFWHVFENDSSDAEHFLSLVAANLQSLTLSSPKEPDLSRGRIPHLPELLELHIEKYSEPHTHTPPSLLEMVPRLCDFQKLIILDSALPIKGKVDSPPKFRLRFLKVFCEYGIDLETIKDLFSPSMSSLQTLVRVGDRDIEKEKNGIYPKMLVAVGMFASSLRCFRLEGNTSTPSVLEGTLPFLRSLQLLMCDQDLPYSFSIVLPRSIVYLILTFPFNLHSSTPADDDEISSSNFPHLRSIVVIDEIGDVVKTTSMPSKETILGYGETDSKIERIWWLWQDEILGASWRVPG